MMGNDTPIDVSTAGSVAAAAAPDGCATILKLASERMRGEAINASKRGRFLMLRPSEGRVYAATHSDLLAAIETCLGSGWELERVQRAKPFKHEACMDLVVFLLQVAYRAKAQLPRFAQGSYRLVDAPNLAPLSAPLSALGSAAPICSALTAGCTSLQALAASLPGGTDPAEIHACLWAVAAANRLVDARSGEMVGGDRSAAAPVRPQPGVLAAIMRWLGRRERSADQAA